MSLWNSVLLLPKKNGGASHWPVLALLLVLCTSSAARGATADDPLESLNRTIFAFNDGADIVVLRPVATLYTRVVPKPARQGVNNFFRHLYDVNGLLNATLQGRFELAMDTAGRLLINSTLGFFGFFDVASDMGIKRYQTDFGHTLAIWGAPRGPYVMLPILGPRTARASVGTLVDGFVSPMSQVTPYEAEWSLRSMDVLNDRVQLLGADQLISGDRYIFLRDVYLQRRAALMNDGVVVDDFSEFDADWEEDDL